jgi:hypothetical protein
LPERAQKWGNHREYNPVNTGAPYIIKNYGPKPACACPDAQNYCPNSLIGKEDVTFTVHIYDLYWGLNVYTYNGAQAGLGEFTVPQLLTKSIDLKSIVHPVIYNSTGFNLFDRLSGHPGHNSKIWRQHSIYMNIDAAGYEEKMPEHLTSRCCPNACPAGFAMNKTFEMVPLYEMRYPETAQDIGNLREALNIKNFAKYSNHVNLDISNETQGKSDREILDILNIEIAAGRSASNIPELKRLKNFENPVLKEIFTKLANGEDIADADIDKLKSENQEQIRDLRDALRGKLEDDGISPVTIQNGETKQYSVQCIEAVAQSRLGCLAEGTQITLANGQKAAIESLKVGDVLKTDIGDSKVIALNKFSQEHDVMFGINGEKPFITVEHPILTESGWKSIDPTKTPESGLGELGKLAVGDKILTETGAIEIKSIEEHKIDVNALAYNIKVENGGALLANDMFVSGFELVEIHY